MQPQYGGSGSNQAGVSSNMMMESLKSNMMTMMMFQQMNGGGGGGRSSGGNTHKQDLFGMIYMFLATNFIEQVFKYLPLLIAFLQKFYMDKFATIQKELANSTVDLTDNKVKKKTASITITVNVNNPDNILGQAILDYITNNKNTTHVSYIRDSFILNQKDVINIDEDIFAKMTESTADSAALTSQYGSGSGSSSGMMGGGGNVGGGASIVQIIEIYSFTRTTDQLRDYLDAIKQKYMITIKNKLGNKRYFFNMYPITAPMEINNRKDFSRLPPNMTFTMKQFQTNRKFSNLFGNDIDLIRSRVHFFTKNRKWYDEKGIPYTLGLLLSGNPGTGKTSTIKCLANETNRHICNVNLNNDITKRQLENLFFNEDITVLNQNTGQTETYSIPLDQRIYVLEDVDCQSDIVRDRSAQTNTNETVAKDPKPAPENPFAPSKKDDDIPLPEDKHRIDLSFLLNLLDGVLENPGRIVIMTSNYPEVLDGALVRPGRIDIIAKFRNCTIETMVKMIEFFYDIRLSPADLDTIYRVQSEIITPAELSKIMFENFTDYQKTIKHLLELSENQVTKESELVYSEDEVEDVISEAGTSSITGSNENTHISNTQIEIKPDDENQQKSPDFKEKMLEYRSIIIKEVFKRYQVIWDSSNNTRFCAKDLIQQLLYNLDEKVFKSDTFLEYSNSRYNIEKTHPEYLKSQNQNQNFVWYFVPRNNEIKNYDMEICKELKIHMKTLYSMISKVISEMGMNHNTVFQYNSYQSAPAPPLPPTPQPMNGSNMGYSNAAATSMNKFSDLVGAQPSGNCFSAANGSLGFSNYSSM